MIALLHNSILIRKYKYWIPIFIFSCIIFASNSHPIILMHGFMGWGRDEMAGYYYWGGFTDLEEY